MNSQICITPQTLVLTSQGWKQVKEIKKGDLLLTENMTFAKVVG